MNFKKVFQNIGKNLLVLLLGAIIGSVLLIIYSLYFWLPANSARLGLGSIAYIPVLIIFSIIIGSVIGSLTALTIKIIIKRFKKKN